MGGYRIITSKLTYLFTPSQIRKESLYSYNQRYSFYFPTIRKKKKVLCLRDETGYVFVLFFSLGHRKCIELKRVNSRFFASCCTSEGHFHS